MEFNTDWFESMLWHYSWRLGHPATCAAMASTMFWGYFEGDGDKEASAEFVMYRSDSFGDIFIVPSPYLTSPSVILGDSEVSQQLGFRALWHPIDT